MSLELRGLAAGYGAGPIIAGIDLDVHAGEIVAVMGRNGMGKTTLLRALMGETRIEGGSVSLDGRRLERLPSHAIARAGLGYVPQGRAIFKDLTVAENLRLGQFASNPKTGNREFDLSVFPVLKERARQRAGTLSGGEQQQLAIARALAGDPRIVLLDEPSEGVQPSIVEAIGMLLQRLAAERTIGILLVEQQLDLAVDIADRTVLLEKGRIEAVFDGRELRRDPQRLVDRLGI